MEMLEYLKWRGDLTFKEKELNEVDALLFSLISYEDFEGILNDQSLTLEEVSSIFFQKYNEEELRKRVTFTNRSYEILKAAASTKRFGSLILSNYVNEIDDELDLQFCAMTIEDKNNFKYITFRGTDDTLVGWKEDFQMTYKDEVLSQRKAVDYVHKIFNQDTFITKVFQTYDYYVGGHSKGGNLAIYASGHVSKTIQKRIVRIDNFDGPGFSQKVWDQPSMQAIIDKIRTYIPTHSFFGRMFIHKGDITVIKAKQIGLLQHSNFNWHIGVGQFIYDDAVSESSDKAVNALNTLLEDMNGVERENLVEGLFDIFQELGIHNFYDVSKLELNKLLKVLKELSELDNKEKKFLLEFIKIIVELSTIKLNEFNLLNELNIKIGG